MIIMKIFNMMNEVVVLGAGSVGADAVKIATGMAAHVTVMDIDLDRLEYLFPAQSLSMAFLILRRQRRFHSDSNNLL
jgi:alanine dehydrogenase